jgi:PAS domain-containing protein
MGDTGDFTMRARWFAWCAAQIAMTAAIGSIRREGSHAARQFGQTVAMLGALPDTVFRADTEGRWQWLSPAWQSLSGEHPADMVGELMVASLAPRYRHQVQQAMDQMLIHGGGVPVECGRAGRRWATSGCGMGHGPDARPHGGWPGSAGRSRPCAIGGQAGRGAPGRGRWHELCDAAPVGIMRADLNGQITYANWAAELTALTGREHLLGMRLSDWLGDDEAFASAALMQKLDMPGAQIERERR